MNQQSIHLVCCSWGVKYAKRLSGELGWDNENLLSRSAHGGGGGIPGHRILCEQMKPDEERVHRGVNRLSQKLRNAMLVKYVMPHMADRADGRDWRNGDMAKVLDVPVNTFLKRIGEAKRLIKKSEFSA